MGETLDSSRAFLEASLPVGGGRGGESCSGEELGGMSWADGQLLL